MAKTDVIQEILKDHEEIKLLLHAVETSDEAKRPDAFKKLVDKLKHHEAAEQKIVHPLGLKSDGGKTATQDRIDEEKEAATVISKIQKLDVSSPDFMKAFTDLKKAVLKHATAEEEKEHPKIRAAVSETKLQELAPQYRQAEAKH